jgi:hypothetical protein
MAAEDLVGTTFFPASPDSDFVTGQDDQRRWRKKYALTARGPRNEEF